MFNTASGSRQGSAITSEGHEHSWCLESQHRTSTGYVLYVRCGACGTRRVDFQEHGDQPPTALSTELRPTEQSDRTMA